MTNDPVEASGRQGGRRRTRKGLIAVLMLLVPIALHQLWDYIEMRRLVSEIQAVIATGAPVTELQAKPGPLRTLAAEKDAGAYYVAAGMIAPRTPSNLTDPAYEWLTGVGPPPAEAHKRSLGVFIDESREALMLVDKAMTLELSRLPAGTDYIARPSHLVNLARLLSARTLSLSWWEDGDAAVRSALSALKVRRLLREMRWPLRVGHDVSAILSLSRPSLTSLVSLQAALEAEDHVDQVVESLLAERAREIESLWRRHYGPDAAVPADYRLPMRSAMQTVRRPLTTHQAVRRLRTWAALIDEARKPWPDRLDGVEALAVQNPDANLPFSWVTPWAIVRDRTSITAIAIERFRRDHAGSLPGALVELVPQYLRSAPIDPYSGAGLLYARDAVSFTVYSVGLNKVDDGGDLISELQAARRRGYGRFMLEGQDEGVRVLIRR